MAFFTPVKDKQMKIDPDIHFVTQQMVLTV